MKRMLAAAFTILLAAGPIQDIQAQGQEKEGEKYDGKRMAVVELSVNYMRNRPDYESGLETQELMGTVVEIVGEDRYWREIITPQPYKAWATSMGLVEMDEEEIKAYEAAPKLIFISTAGHLYAAPSSRSAIISDLVGGDLLRAVPRSRYAASGMVKEEYAWKHLEKKNGWVAAMLPSGKKGYVPRKEVALHHQWLEQTRPDIEHILKTADLMVGVPYLWGGMSFKGVDCSGLVRVSCLMNNYYLPRNASQQVRCGTEVPMETDIRFWEEEHRIEKGSDGKSAGYTEEYRSEMLERTRNLRRGDLVFFGYPATGNRKERITHVGIYIGDNHIIHSSHIVRKNSLIPGDEDFYENSHKLIRARRLEIDAF